VLFASGVVALVITSEEGRVGFRLG
jgi:hypothetical protein